MTSVSLAAQNGHLETIQFLVSNGCNLRTGDKAGILPLHHAAAGDHTAVVRFIIENGGSIIARTGHRKTVRHLSTRLELTGFLVEKGADIHARDHDGSTPLHAAAGKSQAGTVSYLLNCGTDINSCDVNGHPALYFALFEGVLLSLKF